MEQVQPYACSHNDQLSARLSSLRFLATITEHAFRTKKKAGLEEPGLRYWPREADTITFQEGLLSARATGGGGQMRNANSQRTNIMVRPGASQQPPKPHVSHAEIGG
jgi:hypothetical protein